MKNKSFVNAALIFGLAGIIVKVIGAFYKIVLGNILTETGAGYVAFAYPYYNWLLVISTVGFPAAIAKIVAEDLALKRRTAAEELFAIMRKLMIIIGLVTMSLLFILAPFITRIAGIPKAVHSMQAIAIALVFVSYMSAYRGYFQGHSNLLPFGASQIAEQLGRVISGLILAFTLLGFGDEYAAAGATFAATIGAIFGTITLVTYYRAHRLHYKIKKIVGVKLSENKALIKKVIATAMTITLGASVMPIVDMIDSLFIINRLKGIGYGETSKLFYSYHAFYSASLVNFPQILFTAIQASLLPAVSYLIASRNRSALSDTVKTGMKIALLIGVPAAIGMSVLAEPIVSLLWPTKAGVIAQTPRILSIVSLGLIPLSLFQATTGVLQGMGKQKLPAANLMIGAVVKVVVCYALVGIPAINVIGAGISTVLAFVIATSLNIMALFNFVKPNFKLKDIIIKPAVSALLMGISVYFCYGFLKGVIDFRIATFISIFIGIIIYGVLIIASKALDKKDLAFLPGKRFLSKFIK